MKTVPSGLTTHLNQEVTTLCTCWAIGRQDGKTFYFTDSDEDVIQDGNTYISIGAYKRTAIESTATLSVDNLDVVGITNELALPDDDLRAGLFDGATVFIFITSWQNQIRGQIKMRRGFFGEVQTMRNGTYQVELRGLLQRLSYTYTDVYVPTCRLDLGSPSCGIRIPSGQVERNTAYAVGDTVVMPDIGFSQYIGTYTPLVIGDADFEGVGAQGTFDNSAFWEQTEADEVTVATNTPKTGTYAARGSGDGSSGIQQTIDIVQSQKIDSDQIDYTGVRDDLDENRNTANFYAWRRDTSGTGRLRMQFLDSRLRTLGYGRSFKAGTSDATVSSNISLAGDFTIECWAYLGTGVQEDTFGLCGSGTSFDNNSGVHMDIPFNPLRLRYDPDGNNNEVTYANTNVGVERNRWYHFAVTRRISDGQVTCYVDGVQQGQQTGFTETFIVDFVFATLDGSGGSSYDELRIWNTVRTSYEIAENRMFSLVGTETGLIHYWRFNDGTGTPTTGSETINLTPGEINLDVASPAAVRAVHATTSATQSTGFEDTGSEWTLSSFTNVRIPQGSRYIRIIFDATSNGNYVDSMFGWTVDSSGGTIPAILGNNTDFTCTSAGTTGDDLPGFESSIVTDGTATFEQNSNALTRFGLVTDSDGTRVFRAQITDSRAVSGWYNGGLVTFESGSNAGASMEVKDWNATTGEVELFLSMPFNINAGDVFRIYPGCDKTRVSCSAIFDNILNFRGYPDVPGQDDLYRYPDARQ